MARLGEDLYDKPLDDESHPVESAFWYQIQSLTKQVIGRRVSMLERRFSAVIVRVICWPVVAAVFSVCFIYVVLAGIKFGVINRTIAANPSCAALSRDLAGELVSNETASVIAQNRAAGVEGGLGESLVF